jgi:hypothetical protein
MRAPPRHLGFLAVGAAGLTAVLVVAVVVHLSISSLDLVGVRQNWSAGPPAPRGTASVVAGGKATATARPPAATTPGRAASDSSPSRSLTPTASSTQKGNVLDAAAAGQPPTVNCPTVENRLPTIPDDIAAQVDANLAELGQQITAANARLAQSAVQLAHDPDFAQNAILGPLHDKRVATLKRIVNAIDRSTHVRPSHLLNLATCTLNG